MNNPTEQPDLRTGYDSFMYVSHRSDTGNLILEEFLICYYLAGDYEQRRIDIDYITERIDHVYSEWSLKHIIEHPQKSFIIDFVIEADKCHRVVSIDFEDLVAENYDCRYRDFLKNLKQTKWLKHF